MIPHAAPLMLAASLMLKNARLAHCQFIDFEYEATKFLGSLWLAILPPPVLSKFRAFCLKLNLATALISLTYSSSSTAAPCQALVAESPVALPPVSAE
jgi:hypothetical protein